MNIHVRSDGSLELIGVGRRDMELLERLSNGIHVRAYDKSRVYVSFMIIEPELLPKEESKGDSQ